MYRRFSCVHMLTHHLLYESVLSQRTDFVEFHLYIWYVRMCIYIQNYHTVRLTMLCGGTNNKLMFFSQRSEHKIFAVGSLNVSFETQFLCDLPNFHGAWCDLFSCFVCSFIVCINLCLSVPVAQGNDHIWLSESLYIWIFTQSPNKYKNGMGLVNIFAKSIGTNAIYIFYKKEKEKASRF